MLLLDKTLLRLSKGLWGWILLITAVRFLTLIGITSFSVTLSSFLGNMFHPSFSVSEIKTVILHASLAALLTLVSQLLQGELEYRCTVKARTSMRHTIFHKTMELDAGGIEKIGPVSAVTASVDAVENMQVYYSQYLPALLFSVLAPVYLFFQIKNTSLLIACILLVVSLTLLPMHNVFRSKIEHLRKKYWHSVDDMSGTFLDSVRGLTTLKLFDKDKDAHMELKDKAEVLNQNINAFMKVNFTSFLVTEAVIYGTIIVCLAISVSMLVKGTMDISQALTIFMLSYAYFNAIRQLMTATHEALTAVSAAGKVEEILDMDTERTVDPSLKEDPEQYEGIHMDHISFGYEGRKQAIKDVSLYVPKGKTIALAGLSGCGKSTLASLMMRFMDPDSGHIYMEGKDYQSLDVETLRKKIIMVPQSVNIFSGTLRENLLIADDHADDTKLWDALERVNLKDFVEKDPDGLDMNPGNSGSRLSGGQKQKIGIARALLSESEYIIFDEATSAVDPESEREIWKCIDALSKTRTLIIISHRLSTIHNADCIYVLQNGRILEQGKHDDLMKQNGLYHQLVSEQSILEKGEAV